MAIPEGIQKARELGYHPDEILHQIGVQHPEKQEAINTALKYGYDANTVLDEMVRQNTEKKGGLIKQTIANIEKLGMGIGETILRRGEQLRTGTIERVGRGEQGLPSTILQTAGVLAGTVTDIGIEALKAGGRQLGAITPDIIEKPVVGAVKGAGKAFLESGVGQAGLEALRGGFEAYNTWKEGHPVAASNLESAINIGALLPLPKAAGLAARTAEKGAARTLEAGAGAIERGVARVGAKTAERAVSQLDSFIDKSIEKSIRPSVVTQRNLPQAVRYREGAREAVKTIVDNKTNLKFVNEFGEESAGRLPQTLKEFSEALDQTKKVIFTQYDDLAKKAGQRGLKVNLTPIADELDKVAANTVIRDNAPSVATYATRRAKVLRSRKTYTPEQTQEAIKIYNQSLEAFYKNPTYDTASKAYIDSLIVNNMRETLDASIERITEAGYQGLKNQYGALKTIEKDVNKRAIVVARQNSKSIVDFSDIFTSHQIVNGVLTMNPAQVTSGAVGLGIKNLYKYINNPDRVVKSLFETVEKTTARGAKRGIPVKRL